MKLNYNGDRRGFNPKHHYGPDAFGAVYKAVSAVYDAELHRTTITFKPAGNGKDVWRKMAPACLRKVRH